MVLKGTLMKTNLTFRELKVLGRSSEGLVHGVFFYIQILSITGSTYCNK